jgi:thiol-disulfide isomerase/thioredoxin
MNRIHPAARLVVMGGALALLYGLGGCSNQPPSAGAALKSAAKGEMKKLAISDHPAPAPTTPFKDAQGQSHTLAEFKGRVAVVNVWANWCAPCKAEIPSLAKLAAAYAGQPVAVVPVSVGKGEDETAGHAFIDRNAPLTFYSEPTYSLTYAFKPVVEDMPTTILYDRKGVERARLAGGADWSGPDAKALIDTLVAEK